MSTRPRPSRNVPYRRTISVLAGSLGALTILLPDAASVFTGTNGRILSESFYMLAQIAHFGSPVLFVVLLCACLGGRVGGYRRRA